MAQAVSKAGERAPAQPKLKGGWRVVAAKELADHVLSVRFTILMLVLGLALIAAVYAASSGIRDVASSSADFPALFLKLFTAAPQRIPPFFALVGFLGPLLGIAFGFDAVNGERTQGTLPRLASQPIYRDDVVNGKFVAGLSVVSMGLGGLVILVAGIGMIRIGVIPDFAQLSRLFAYLVLSIVYVGFWLALATLFSVLLRRAATSALAAIAAWLVATLFASLIVGLVGDALAPLPDNPTPDETIHNARAQQNIARVFPATLYQEATIILLNPQQRTLDALGSLILSAEPKALPGSLSIYQSLLVVWPQVTLLIAMTVLCFGGAYVAFMRQEIRA